LEDRCCANVVGGQDPSSLGRGWKMAERESQKWRDLLQDALGD
jgi:hypothetical protein